MNFSHWEKERERERAPADIQPWAVSCEYRACITHSALCHEGSLATRGAVGKWMVGLFSSALHTWLPGKSSASSRIFWDHKPLDRGGKKDLKQMHWKSHLNKDQYGEQISKKFLGDLTTSSGQERVWARTIQEQVGFSKAHRAACSKIYWN